MFKKKNEIDNEGLNEIIYLGRSILKVLFVALIIGIIGAVVAVGHLLGVFSFLGSVLKILSPLFIGFVIAWLFAPFVDKMAKKGMPRILASILVYVIFIIFLVVFIRIFIPVLYEEINELLKTLPSIISKITDFINTTFTKIKIEGIDIASIKDNILININNYAKGLSESLPNTLMTTISSLASGVGNIFFGLIIGLYMLFDFNNLTKTLIKFLPRKYREETATLLDNIGREVRKCVNGTLLVACMVFVCDVIGFSIVGLNAALLFGLFCGITDLIPYIGPYIGTATATIVGLTQSPLTGILVLIIATIVQFIESYVLQPVVMSKATNLHPVVIIVGLLIFGHFFGIVGMILATPILSIIKVIWQFLDNKYDFFENNDLKVEKALK